MSEKNPNFRLEMFSDGVFAIAITLLILEIKVPSLASMNSRADVWKGIWHLWPSFLALMISFIVILISWKGHHNVLKYLDKTSDQFQFVNGFFLFTVVVIPFPTAFMAEYIATSYAQPAIVFYCLCMLLHNLGWRLLFRSIFKPASLTRDPSADSYIKKMARGSRYGTFVDSGLIIVAWWLPYIALALSLLLWIFWLVLGSWLMAWREWFNLRQPKWIPKIIALLTLFFMAAQLLGISWVSHSAHTYFLTIADYTRLLLLALCCYLSSTRECGSKA